MVWARLDDEILDNEKVVRAGALGFALHTAAITWCSRKLTDGFVPRAKVRTLLDFTSVAIELGVDPALLDPMRYAERNATAGLWRWDPDRDGWWLHDFLDYNPPKEKVLAERDRAKGKAKPRSGGASPEPPAEPPLEAGASLVPASPGPGSRSPLLPLGGSGSGSSAEDFHPRAGVRVAPDVPPMPESTPRAKRPLSLRRLEEGFLAASFAEGVAAVTGAAYAVPDDERRALDDLVDAHCPVTAQGGAARDDWLRATARRFREAVRGREKFHRFGGPRGCLDWLNAGAPSADELAKSPDDLRLEVLEARRKAKAAESARVLRRRVRDDDAAAMPPAELAQAASGVLRALGGGR